MKNKIYEFYRNYYDLDNLKIGISNNDMMFLIYDDDFNYYIKNTRFLLENLGEDSILTICNKLNTKYQLNILNYYPVCRCNKTIVMAFRTSIVKSSILKKVRYSDLKGHYKKIVGYHINNFKHQFDSNSLQTEIKMSQKYINRYKFHENYIKKYILTKKKRKKSEFAKLLNQLIPKGKSIIDISCGDNDDIFEMATKKNYEIIVGNDIGINYLKTHSEKNLIFTNDNILKSNMKTDAFDVSVCKNTLHHMNSKEKMIGILQFMDKISKQIVIIEISNPQKQKGLPKFLNKYLYTKFLKDSGHCYIDEGEFRELIESTLTNHRITYSNFENILGNFMVAKIERV